MKARETLLEQSYARMERGQPPSDDIEGEWLNSLKKEVTRMQAAQEKKKVSKCILLINPFGATEKSFELGLLEGKEGIHKAERKK